MRDARGGRGPGPGAAVWFQLARDFKGDVKVEILDAKGQVIAQAKATLSGGRKPPVPDERDEKDEKGKDDDDEDAPKRKLEPQPGLNRFVWDLTHDGATVIPGAPVDSGSAAARVPVAPGTYTVRLTVGKQTLTQTVEVKADPRLGASPVKLALAALADQQSLALRVRDDISKLSDAVLRIRAVKKQIELRKELLKDRDDAKGRLKRTDALAKSLDEIEGKLHNAKAKISYDIFAAKGGAMLYSQFAWLLTGLTEADGAPTKAQTERVDELEKELAGLLARLDAVATGDVARLNAEAKKLGVPELYVPPAKKPEAKPPAGK